MIVLGPFKTRAEMRRCWPMDRPERPAATVKLVVPRQMPADEREQWIRAAVSAAAARKWLTNPRAHFHTCRIEVADRKEGVGVFFAPDAGSQPKAA